MVLYENGEFFAEKVHRKFMQKQMKLLSGLRVTSNSSNCSANRSHCSIAARAVSFLRGQLIIRLVYEHCMHIPDASVPHQDLHVLFRFFDIRSQFFAFSLPVFRPASQAYLLLLYLFCRSLHGFIVIC